MLVDFLFRCPYCGHDPMEGKGVRASCSGCGRSFEPGKGGTAIRVDGDGKGPREVPAGILSRQMDDHGGALSLARGEDGRLRHHTRVRARFAHRESPVRFRGEFLGLFELFGVGDQGILALEHDHLTFHPGPQAPENGDGSGGGGETRVWPLLELRALQTSSSSAQISPRGGGVVLFRFPEDSVKRWEELLRGAISEVWEEAGRGKVIEFQPRIRTQ
jgi:hypothetical protein